MELERRLRVVRVERECRVDELLREMDLNPEIYYVVRDQRILFPHERLQPGQMVAVLPLIAGG